MKRKELEFEEFNLDGKMGKGFFSGVKVLASDEIFAMIHKDSRPQWMRGNKDKFYVLFDHNVNTWGFEAFRHQVNQKTYMTLNEAKQLVEKVFKLFCKNLQEKFFDVE